MSKSEFLEKNEDESKGEAERDEKKGMQELREE